MKIQRCNFRNYGQLQSKSINGLTLSIIPFLHSSLVYCKGEISIFNWTSKVILQRLFSKDWSFSELIFFKYKRINWSYSIKSESVIFWYEIILCMVSLLYPYKCLSLGISIISNKLTELENKTSKQRNILMFLLHSSEHINAISWLRIPNIFKWLDISHISDYRLTFLCLMTCELWIKKMINNCISNSNDLTISWKGQIIIFYVMVWY